MYRLFGVALLISTFLMMDVGAQHWPWQGVVGCPYLFGYAGVEANAAFTYEIESNGIPTNMQTLTATAANENVGEKIAFLNSRGARAIIILDKLLFLNDPALATPCGPGSWRNRIDYKAKFDAWLNVNGPHLTPQQVAILVINTEVNNRCISHVSLDGVTQYVKSKVPDIPSFAGYGNSTEAKPLPETIPASLAGVAFFKYQVFDPGTDAVYQAAFNNLKSKLTPEQRILLVPDSFYDSRHAALGWPKWYLGYVALNYKSLALSDPQVIGLLLFLWPGFAEFGEAKLGARDLPQNVRDRQRLAGCELNITNPFVPACN